MSDALVSSQWQLTAGRLIVHLGCRLPARYTRDVCLLYFADFLFLVWVFFIFVVPKRHFGKIYTTYHLADFEVVVAW